MEASCEKIVDLVDRNPSPIMSTHSTDTEIENDTFSKDVLTVGVYSNIEDAESQDRVAPRLCLDLRRGDRGRTRRQAHRRGRDHALQAVPRRRLGPQVFFYMLTGQLINKNDKPKCDVNGRTRHALQPPDRAGVGAYPGPAHGERV